MMLIWEHSIEKHLEIFWQSSITLRESLCSSSVVNAKHFHYIILGHNPH